MKKVILVLVGISFLLACSGQEETPAITAQEKAVATFLQTKPESPANNFQTQCTINGHDCWEVVQLLKETKPVYSAFPETEMYSPDIESFKNSALEAKGFSVGYYSKHTDGGITASILWGESDFVNIGTHYTDAGPNLLLIWSDGSQKELDPQGNLVK